jgi:hypothetical protein
MITYTISARGKAPTQPIEDFLKFFNVSLENVDSVFGFTEFCRLYGGRPFMLPELSNDDLTWMYNNNIGYRIPLQNTIASLVDYESSKPFLEKHHREGNTIILARDRFVEKIRKDFPLYKLEASVIKKIDSIKKGIANLKIYDTIVPDPQWFNNTDDEFPEEYKDRIRLFANAGCMYACPQRICYNAVSKMNLNLGKFQCSKHNGVERPLLGMTNFDVDNYIKRGYNKFKLLRARPNHNSSLTTGY